MIEVELKVPVKGREQLENRLLEIGFAKGNLVKEIDAYFDNQDDQIKDGDGALRIRSCVDLSTNTAEHFMTYKGPKMDAVSMTRKEFEMQIEDAQVGKEILMALGFNKVYPVVKNRQYYFLDQITACLDHVEGLGEFLELEIMAARDDDRPQALEKLVSLLEELGYSSKDTIRKSYLSMLQI